MFKKILFTIALLFTTLCAAPHQVHATAAVNAFTAKAVLPADNAKTVSHFDLTVQPNQTRTLSVAVTNQAAKAQTFAVSAANAITNSNGIITYDQGDAKTKPTHIAFCDLLPEATNTTVTIPAHSTKDVGFQVKVPAKAFSGLVLGAINVRSLTAEATAKKQSGVSNLANYVIGVELRENATPVTPQLKLQHVNYQSQNSLPIVAIRLQNPTPTIIGTIHLTAQVKNAAGKTKAKINAKQLNFAPNNTFTYALPTTGQRALAAGKYRLNMTVAADNGHWHFTKAFTVSKKRAATKIVHHHNYKQWLWRIIDALAVLIIIIAIIKRLFKRRKHA